MKIILISFILLACGFSVSAQTAGAPAVKKKAPHPSYAEVEDVEGLPRVLLLGDSISMGYTLTVRRALEGKANVHRPKANCGPTVALR